MGRIVQPIPFMPLSLPYLMAESFTEENEKVLFGIE